MIGRSSGSNSAGLEFAKKNRSSGPKTSAIFKSGDGWVLSFMFAL
jgi:hypothetical protein